jgi:hypothetical protein
VFGAQRREKSRKGDNHFFSSNTVGQMGIKNSQFYADFKNGAIYFCN